MILFYRKYFSLGLVSSFSTYKNKLSMNDVIFKLTHTHNTSWVLFGTFITVKYSGGVKAFIFVDEKCEITFSFFDYKLNDSIGLTTDKEQCERKKMCVIKAKVFSNFLAGCKHRGREVEWWKGDERFFMLLVFFLMPYQVRHSHPRRFLPLHSKW